MREGLLASTRGCAAFASTIMAMASAAAASAAASASASAAAAATVSQRDYSSCAVGVTREFILVKQMMSCVSGELREEALGYSGLGIDGRDIVSSVGAIGIAMRCRLCRSIPQRAWALDRDAAES